MRRKRYEVLSSQETRGRLKIQFLKGERLKFPKGGFHLYPNYKSYGYSGSYVEGNNTITVCIQKDIFKTLRILEHEFCHYLICKFFPRKERLHWLVDDHFRI